MPSLVLLRFNLRLSPQNGLFPRQAETVERTVSQAGRLQADEGRGGREEIEGDGLITRLDRWVSPDETHDERHRMREGRINGRPKGELLGKTVLLQGKLQSRTSSQRPIWTNASLDTAEQAFDASPASLKAMLEAHRSKLRGSRNLNW